MPNIGALLKQEIVRLSRRETRTQVQAIQKASAQYRRHIAALKRQVATLERQVATLERQVTLLQRRVLDKPSATPAGSTMPKMRFVAKGLMSQRNRLGFSAADYGRLVGVSAQSIYNWEQGEATPRAEQLAKIAVLRGIGKRQATRMLEQLPQTRGKSTRKS